MGSAWSIAYNAPHEVLTVALSPLELCLSNTLNGKKPGGEGLMPASPDFRGESPSLINSADPALTNTNEGTGINPMLSLPRASACSSSSARCPAPQVSNSPNSRGRPQDQPSTSTGR